MRRSPSASPAVWAALGAFLVAMRDVSFTRGAGWVVAPLLPGECGPLRCIGYHGLVGRTVRLTLVTEIDGTERTFDWTQCITRAVRSIRGGRPTDPDPH